MENVKLSVFALWKSNIQGFVHGDLFRSADVTKFSSQKQNPMKSQKIKIKEEKVKNAKNNVLLLS